MHVMSGLMSCLSAAMNPDPRSFYHRFRLYVLSISYKCFWHICTHGVEISEPIYYNKSHKRWVQEFIIITKVKGYCSLQPFRFLRPIEIHIPTSTRLIPAEVGFYHNFQSFSPVLGLFDCDFPCLCIDSWSMAMPM